MRLCQPKIVGVALFKKAPEATNRGALVISPLFLDGVLTIGLWGLFEVRPVVLCSSHTPQGSLWGVCELHRTTRGTSNKPTTLLSYCGRANHPGSRSACTMNTALTCKQD